MKQNQFLIYWRPGANNVGDYVSKHHPPAHHQTMHPNFFVNIVCQNPFSSTENCLHRLSICLQRGCDNPTSNSSIVRYDSNCSHKPCGTSKPTFPHQRVIFPHSLQSAKYRIVTHNFTNDDLTDGNYPSYHSSQHFHVACGYCTYQKTKTSLGVNHTTPFSSSCIYFL